MQGANTQLMYPFIDPVAIKQIGADDQNGIDFLYDPSSSVRLQSAATYYVGGATYDNNYPAVGYKGRNWTGGSPFSHALFQTASWSNQTGASSWFAFLGARVTWVFAKAANRGWQDVYIDGTLVESINTDDNDDNLWQVHRTWDMDTPGYHVIEIRGLGNGTDYTDLDGYVVDILRAQGAHDDTSGYVRYIGNWTHSSGWPNADNGTVSWSNTADDAVVFTFVGDGITYSFTKGPNRGKVKVTIDGEYKETIDLYSAAPQWSVDRRWPLSLGTHTIHLAVTGEKHSSSSGIYVDVDQLAVD